MARKPRPRSTLRSKGPDKFVKTTPPGKALKQAARGKKARG